MGERLESELDPSEDAARKRAAAERDPDTVLFEVGEFAELARAGAYMAGDGRVAPKERTRWRLTFRRLAGDALAALPAADSGPAEQAVALPLDLARETLRSDYFPSEGPMEAAPFVVSHAAATLWGFVPDRHRFAPVAPRGAALVQLPGLGLPPQRADPQPRRMALPAAGAPGRIAGRGPAGPPRQPSRARRT